MIENTSSQDSITSSNKQLIHLAAGAVDLEGILHLPLEARGIVILAYGIENREYHPHQNAIMQATLFNESGLATLIVDLFSSEERKLDDETSFFHNNIEIMQQRLIGIAEWLLQNEETRNLSIGYFGTHISGSAALVAAAERPDTVRAVVASGAHISAGQERLSQIVAPTLLIAAEEDEAAVKANQEAFELLKTEKRFEQLEGARTVYADKQVGEAVARLAEQWFTRWLVPIV